MPRQSNSLATETSDAGLSLARTEIALRRRVLSGIALALVLTGLMGFLGWRSAEKAAENADWVTHTYAARNAIDATRKQVIDMETGVRGFAVTDDDSFLEFYREGQRALPQDLKLVRQLTADDPAQQQRLERLVAQVNARLEVLSATLETTQRTGVPPKALLLEGRRRMDAVRATVAEM